MTANVSNCEGIESDKQITKDNNVTLFAILNFWEYHFDLLTLFISLPDPSSQNKRSHSSSNEVTPCPGLTHSVEKTPRKASPRTQTWRWQRWVTYRIQLDRRTMVSWSSEYAGVSQFLARATSFIGRWMLSGFSETAYTILELTQYIGTFFCRVCKAVQIGFCEERHHLTCIPVSI